MLQEKIKKKSGRPDGTSTYKEKTVPIRIPITLVPFVKNLLSDYLLYINNEKTLKNFNIKYKLIM